MSADFGVSKAFVARLLDLRRRWEQANSAVQDVRLLLESFPTGGATTADVQRFLEVNGSQYPQLDQADVVLAAIGYAFVKADWPLIIRGAPVVTKVEPPPPHRSGGRLAEQAPKEDEGHA